MTIHNRFHHWLSRRRGTVIKAEDFHAHMARHGHDAGDWQRTMTRLVNEARTSGRLRACGLTRDRFGSWKAKWRVVA